MIGLIRYYQRNKILYELLEQYSCNSDSQYDNDIKILIQIDDLEINSVVRMNELCFLNRQNIGYAMVKDKEKNLCLLLDRYERTSEAEIHPFEDGRVTIDTYYKKKKQTIRFILTDEK